MPSPRAPERVVSRLPPCRDPLQRVAGTVSPLRGEVAAVRVVQVPDGVIRTRYVAGTGVSLQTPLAETLPPIYGDRIQLQRVIVDLTINAVEAISGVGVGLRELLMSTARTESNV